MVLHGDGSPTRRYLYAGDAADAFDTILHRGQLGQIYNVGSQDEISNLALCGKLLAEMSLSQGDSEGHATRWIKYTHDRPFNDHRYAVDGTKLRRLGWEQRTNFADGLRTTVEWYRRFGERWWGDITKVLCPFPVVDGFEVHSDREPVTDTPQPAGTGKDGGPGNGGLNGAAKDGARKKRKMNSDAGENGAGGVMKMETNGDSQG
jgi:hypothetical protein